MVSSPQAYRCQADSCEAPGAARAQTLHEGRFRLPRRAPRFAGKSGAISKAPLGFLRGLHHLMLHEPGSTFSLSFQKKLVQRVWRLYIILPSRNGSNDINGNPWGRSLALAVDTLGQSTRFVVPKTRCRGYRLQYVDPMGKVPGYAWTAQRGCCFDSEANLLLSPLSGLATMRNTNEHHHKCWRFFGTNLEIRPTISQEGSLQFWKPTLLVVKLDFRKPTLSCFTYHAYHRSFTFCNLRKPHSFPGHAILFGPNARQLWERGPKRPPVCCQTQLAW